MTTFAFQNVQPKAGTPGVAQEAPQGAPPQAPPPGGGMLGMLLPFLIFIPILFMMFRRQKKEAQARASLKKGDRVVSTSGLIGELVELGAHVAKVKIAPGTTVEMLTNAVSPFGNEATSSKEAAASKESKDAKTVSEKK